MGNTSYHLELTENDIVSGKLPMLKSSPFTTEELKKLFRNFRTLDRDDDGFLSKDEFMVVEALQQNPLVMRVLQIFDDDKNDKIDFGEFVAALSIFSSRSSSKDEELAKKAKQQFAFKIYDVNGDGFISNGDLFTILKIMVGDNLNDIQLQQLVDRTILQADKDKDGKLSESEFVDFIQNSDIENKLTIDMSQIGNMQQITEDV